MQQTLKSGNSAHWYLLFGGWVIALVALLGSIFLSEVMGLIPCELCWWQRVFMYPLVVILLVGLFPFDRRVTRYALPFVVIGWTFAIFHYLLYSGYIPKSLQPCSEGPSCSDINLEIWGIITIPMLSIFSFSILFVLLIMIHRRN